jgi:hypothetical protein
MWKTLFVLSFPLLIGQPVLKQNNIDQVDKRSSGPRNLVPEFSFLALQGYTPVMKRQALESHGDQSILPLSANLNRA